MNQDYVPLIAVMAAGFLIIWLVSNVLKFFVALREPPLRRAAYIVGPAYIALSIPALLLPMEGYEYFIPFTNLPGAALAFWFHLRQFRFAWVESEDELPDGVELANHDWQTGLVKLLAVIVLGLIVVGIKMTNKLYWGG